MVQPLNPPAGRRPAEPSRDAATAASVDCVPSRRPRLRRRLLVGGAVVNGVGLRSRPDRGCLATADGDRGRGSRGGPWLIATRRARCDWDAPTYDRIADPMTRWGTVVLDRLPLRGDETVLDAGCGSGRVTERLVDRLPRGPGRRARRLARDDRGGARAAGAVRRPGELRDRGPGRARCRWATRASTRSCRPPPSTGWPTTTRCSGTSRVVLRPGGRLVAQCGGQGNTASVRAVLAEVGRRLARAVDVRLARGDDTSARGRRVHRRGGVADGRADAASSRARRCASTSGRSSSAPTWSACRPPIGTAFVEAVATRLPASSIDYVRLNILATRGETSETAA